MKWSVFNVPHKLEMFVCHVQDAMVDVKPGFFEKSTTGVVGRGKADEESEAEQDVEVRRSRKSAFPARGKVRFARCSIAAPKACC